MARKQKLDFSGIKLIVLDFDGVLTTNQVIHSENGAEGVIRSRADSLGLDMLRAAAPYYEVVILSTEKNMVVTRVAAKLKLVGVHPVDDKLQALHKLLAARNIACENVLYMGNDVNDLTCLGAVGLSVVPADGHPTVRRVADYVTKASGGNGAVREVCDMILEQVVVEEIEPGEWDQIDVEDVINAPNRNELPDLE